MERQQLKRVIRTLWITGTAAVVIIAAAAWWLGEQHHDTHRDDAAVLGDVLVSRDGRTLTTTARWAPCQTKRPQLQARESTDTVTVALRETTADLRHQCASTDQQVSATLTEPLGQRRLVDAGTGTTITSFDAAQLVGPHYLPQGYTQTNEIYDEPSTERCAPSPFNRTDTPAWTRFYRKGSARPSLAIAQVAKAAPDDARNAPASVGGHPAHLREQASSRCLTWYNGKYSMTVLSQDPPLPTAELLRIANQLGH
ncbi:hypothetical protein [Streptomyces sp. NPDC049555]|uniref:hypothetical protein n=1 Tax=Streptomyces sp. NPDC049555 TaxID=3154930 RepID=UPI0034179CB9